MQIDSPIHLWFTYGLSFLWYADKRNVQLSSLKKVGVGSFIKKSNVLIRNVIKNIYLMEY